MTTGIAWQARIAFMSARSGDSPHDAIQDDFDFEQYLANQRFFKELDEVGQRNADRLRFVGRDLVEQRVLKALLEGPMLTSELQEKLGTIPGSKALKHLIEQGWITGSRILKHHAGGACVVVRYSLTEAGKEIVASNSWQAAFGGDHA